MSATVQATCPGCRNVLRIPADWADRALKCKKCGTVVQARKRTAAASPASLPTAVPVPAAPPVAAYPQPVPVPEPAAETVNAFVTEADSPVLRKYRGRKRRAWVGPLVVGVVLAGLAAGGYAVKDRVLPPEPPKGDGDGTPKGVTTPAAAKLSDPFPRRLLFVHVSKYVYFNPLAAGKSAKGADLPTETARKMAFELRVPTDKGNDQLFTLIDTDPTAARRPLAGVLRHGFEQFFATCRPQDRAVVYFGGHAVERDGKAYLVPLDGEPDDPATLLPLADVYAKLKECKAQQKVLLFDVCRFNPGFGASRPGGEPMGEPLLKALLAAPPGVQVLTSCSAGENAQETTELGSEFLTAFRVVAGGAKGAKPTPADPIAVDGWASALRAALTSARGDTPPQTPKLAGAESGAKAEYARDEPPAARFDWPPAPAGAAADQVAKVLALAALPPIRPGLEVPAGAAEAYPFPADRMKAYAADGVTEEQVRKDPAKYPVRAAALEAMELLRKNWAHGADGGLRESFEGAADERVKKEVLREQEPIAKMQLGLTEAMELLEKAEKQLDQEKSPRWRALFQYALAQAQMRWAYMQEYNLSLGNIRTDSLGKAPAGGGLPTWRLVSVEKMKSKKDVKEKADAARELMGKIAEEHKGTPWELLAKMHKAVALGLDWKLVEAKPGDGKGKKETS